MSFLRTPALVACAAALALTSCGNASNDSHPIELLYFVQGPTGTPFEVVDADNNADCMAESRGQISGLVPSAGFGFQSGDTTHTLPGRFVAPHYFVIENERQPTRAVLRNLGEVPLTVLQQRGLASPATTLETRIIPPGECRSISTFSDEEEKLGTSQSSNLAPEYRVEVCGFAGDTKVPNDFECADIAPRGPTEFDEEDKPLIDIGAAFFATLGDLDVSFLTRCLQLENSEQVSCRTPATFYLFNPRDLIGIAMTQISGGVPSFLQVDLYRGDNLIGSNRGSGDVFIRNDI